MDTVCLAKCLFLHCFTHCASVTTVKCETVLHKEIQPCVFKFEMLCMKCFCVRQWGWKASPLDFQNKLLNVASSIKMTTR